MNSIRVKRQNDKGFTLIELFVIIVILVLLAATILPALASTRPNNQATQCLNNLRRLVAAWNMFPCENNDEIMSNPGWVGSAYLDWTANPGNTNSAPLLTNVMGSYVKSAALFKCPADKYLSPIQYAAGFRARVRSVSLNGVLAGPGGGSGPFVKGPVIDANRNQIGKFFGSGSQGTGSAVRKTTQLVRPGPSDTFVTLDEHPDSINDATFMFDVGYGRGQEIWRDLPASYHNGGVGISYADGRAEVHQWKERTDPVNRTIYPVRMVATGPWQGLTIDSLDYRWVQDRMPYLEK